MWAEIRKLIVGCEELPEGVRTKLVGLGDQFAANTTKMPMGGTVEL